MAKFGLFESNRFAPRQQYEGDYMKQNGEYVMIFKGAPGTDPDRQVAAIRLEKGQSVREIEAATGGAGRSWSNRGR